MKTKLANKYLRVKDLYGGGGELPFLIDEYDWAPRFKVRSDCYEKRYFYLDFKGEHFFLYQYDPNSRRVNLPGVTEEEADEILADLEDGYYGAIRDNVELKHS